MTKTGKKLMVAFLSMAMAAALISMFRITQTVYAAQGDPAITEDTGVLAKSANSENGIQRIWYGGQDWIVIAYDGKDGNGNVLSYKNAAGQTEALYREGTATVLYDGSVWENTTYREDWAKDNYYEGSDLQLRLDSWLPGKEHEKITEGEKRLILPRTLPGGKIFNSDIAGFDKNKVYGGEEEGKDVENQYFWPLSEAEAEQVPRALLGYGEEWWLRTPGSARNFGVAVFHHPDGGGYLNDQRPLEQTWAIRPAFDLNLESVLLMSAAEDGKISGEGADALTLVGTNPGDEWKITVPDDLHKRFAVESVETTAGGALRVRYSGAETGDNEYISAVVETADGTVKYYGRLGAASGAADASVVMNTEGKWIPANGDRLYIFSEQFNGDKATDYSSAFIRIDPEDINSDGALTGSGTEADPYVIAGVSGWNNFSESVADGSLGTEGKYFRLDKDIRISRMAGTSSHPFSGIFDGNGRTLTFNKTADSKFCAPFAYTKGAYFRNLIITGEISTQYDNAAGLAGYASGLNHVTNCRSSISIVQPDSSTRGSHSGFIAQGAAVFEGCVFDGRIIAKNARYCSGFLGYYISGEGHNDSACVNCMFAPSAMETKSDTSTFIRTKNEAENCYYMAAIGQGRDKGKMAHSITGGAGVGGMDFGSATQYSVSSLTAYQTGLAYKGTFYAGKGDTVSFSLPEPGTGMEYEATSGTFSGSGKNYTVVMEDKDVEIRKVGVNLNAPENVVLEGDVIDGCLFGYSADLTAAWDTVEDADGYYLTLYSIDGGKERVYLDPIKITEPEITGGTVSYDLDLELDDDSSSYTFLVKVSAFNNKGKSSAEAASNPIGICDFRMNIKGSNLTVRVLKGARVSDCIKAFFDYTSLDSYYIEDGYYFCKENSEADKVIAFMPHNIEHYSSLAELKADAYLVPPGEHISNADVTKDLSVWTIMEGDLCPADSDLHSWQNVKAIQKASFMNSNDSDGVGTVLERCSKCRTERVYQLAPIEKITISTNSFPYTGKAITPAVAVTDTAGKKLKAGVDYTVAYSNNVNPGTATATVTLRGDYYEGSRTLNFTITPAPTEPEPTKPEPTPAPLKDEDVPYDKPIDAKNAPTAETMEKLILANSTDEAPAGSRFNLLQLRATKVKKNSIKIQWTAVKGATGYIIYGAKCGEKYSKLQVITTGSTKSWTQKKLAKGKYYKYYIIAIQKYNGTDRVIASSKTIHIATSGGKVGNFKSVKLTNPKKTKIKLKVGKNLKIKGKAVAASKKLKPKTHRKLQYESTNPAIAEVSKKGKITAKKAGTCNVYVYAQNGVFKKIKVTVKK